jgi:hypothetical protein
MGSGATTLAVLCLAFLPLDISAMQRVRPPTPDTVARFHTTLTDSAKHEVYVALFKEAKGIVDQVWGEPSDWAELCGAEPEGQTNTLGMDPAIRSFSPYAGFEEPYPRQGLEWLLEHKLIDGVCQSNNDSSWCEDSTSTLTAGLSTIRPVEDGAVEVTLRLYRLRPACPEAERMGSFASLFRIVLEQRNGSWVVTDTQLLWIT